MRKRARVIYNPTSGREQMERQVPYILDRMEQAGYETSAFMTRGEGDARDEARRASEDRFEAVIAAGGDGTIFEVINGIAEQEWRPKTGLIPAGTTNDFARALGLQGKEIKEVCDVFARGRTQGIDIGKANDSYFINIAAGGKLTELTYDTPKGLKTALGQAAYFIKGFEKFWSLHPQMATVEYDGKFLEEEITMFLVSNTNSVGGFEKLLPQAEYNDGYFDVLIVQKMTMFEFSQLLRQALRGRHLDNPKIKYFKAKQLRIEAQEDMQLNLDGEYGGHLPTTFENLYQHIELFCP